MSLEFEPIFQDTEHFIIRNSKMYIFPYDEMQMKEDKKGTVIKIGGSQLDQLLLIVLEMKRIYESEQLKEELKEELGFR